MSPTASGVSCVARVLSQTAGRVNPGERRGQPAMVRNAIGGLPRLRRVHPPYGSEVARARARAERDQDQAVEIPQFRFRNAARAVEEPPNIHARAAERSAGRPRISLSTGNFRDLTGK